MDIAVARQTPRKSGLIRSSASATVQNATAARVADRDQSCSDGIGSTEQSQERLDIHETISKRSRY